MLRARTPRSVVLARPAPTEDSYIYAVSGRCGDESKIECTVPKDCFPREWGHDTRGSKSTQTAEAAPLARYASRGSFVHKLFHRTAAQGTTRQSAATASRTQCARQQSRTRSSLLESCSTVHPSVAASHAHHEPPLPGARSRRDTIWGPAKKDPMSNVCAHATGVPNDQPSSVFRAHVCAALRRACPTVSGLGEP